MRRTVLLAALGLVVSITTLVALAAVWLADTRADVVAATAGALPAVVTDSNALVPTRLGRLPVARPRLPAPGSVGLHSGRPADLDRRVVVTPTALRVPRLGVDAKIDPAGVEGRNRVVSLPKDPRRVGWYRFGASPGRPGTSVLVAHAVYDGRPGPFLKLSKLSPGSRVKVAFASERARSFRVVARREYDKHRLPERLWAVRGRPLLALVTCSGRFDPSRRRYENNTVVYAVPA